MSFIVQLYFLLSKQLFSQGFISICRVFPFVYRRPQVQNIIEYLKLEARLSLQMLQCLSLIKAEAEIYLEYKETVYQLKWFEISYKNSTTSTSLCSVNCLGVVFGNGTFPLVCGQQLIALTIYAVVWGFSWGKIGSQLDQIYPILSTRSSIW